MPPGPVFGVVHADPRTFDDGNFFGQFGRGDEKVVAPQIVAVQPAINTQRAAEQAAAGAALLGLTSQKPHEEET